MQVGIFADAEQIADVAAALVIRALTRTDNPVLGVATGSTPLPLYARLREEHRAGRFNLEGVRAFALDEYVGIDPDHPQAYRNVLREELVGPERTGLREEDLHTPDAIASDPHVAAAQYEADVRAAGVKVQILGLGVTGHIGFNEPGGSLASRTHVEALAPQTRQDNARFFDGDVEQVPHLCVTQGLGTIMDAQQLVLMATGQNKAPAVRALVEGSVSARWPASVLQWHPDTVVLLDEAAAADLELADFYRERWETMREAGR